MRVHNIYLKRILSFLLAFSLLICIFIVPASAANLGTLNYWYSDMNTIMRWTSVPASVWTQKLNYHSNFYFAEAMSTAVNSWNSALSCSMSIVPLIYPSNRSITFIGGTKEEIDAHALNIPLDESDAGKTRMTYTDEGTWKYGSVTKYGGIMTNAEGCVVETSGYTENKYKNIGIHELGHALGWDGHSANSTDVMYATVNSNTVLTVRDKRHLQQVYGGVF